MIEVPYWFLALWFLPGFIFFVFYVFHENWGCKDFNQWIMIPLNLAVLFGGIVCVLCIIIVAIFEDELQNPIFKRRKR